jgi:hypothetical protein
LLPFFFHWYTGDAPPLVGVAVNVTGEFWQIVAADPEMLTPGVTVAFAATLREAVGELAQAEYAVTVTLPPVVPGKACMLVPEVVPLHPEGRVHE